MKNYVKAGLMVAGMLFAAPLFAAESRHINDEPMCETKGSGMDPRCVGSTAPGTVSDMTTHDQHHQLDQGRTLNRDSSLASQR